MQGFDVAALHSCSSMKRGEINKIKVLYLNIHLLDIHQY